MEYEVGGVYRLRLAMNFLRSIGRDDWDTIEPGTKFVVQEIDKLKFLGGQSKVRFMNGAVAYTCRHYWHELVEAL